MRDRLLLALFVLLRGATDLVRLVGEPARFDNGEERYNATVGWYLAHAGLSDALLALQYKSFCGGCSVHGVASALTLGLFGDHVGAWKLLAFVWTAAIHVLGFVALDRRVNRAAAWSFALLYALPPSGLADLQLMLWGNHAEGALFLVAALALRPGFAQGLVLGVGLWFTRTTAHGLVLLLPALHARSWRTLVGLVLGVAPMMLPAAAGDVGTYDLGLRANLLPMGLGAALDRARLLVTAQPLGPRLLPMVTGAAPWAWSWIAAVGVAFGVLVVRRSGIAAMFFAFALAWALSGFEVPKALPHAALLQHRYFAPWLFLGVLGGAAAAGHLPRVPRALLLVALLAAPLRGLVALGTRVRPDPSVLSVPVVDHTWFDGIAYRRLPLARVQAAHSADPDTERALRRLEGYVAADLATTDPSVRARLSGPTVSAFWQAQTDPKGAWGDLAGLNRRLLADPDPVAAGRGAAANIAWDAPKGVDLLPRLRAGLSDADGCPLCAVLGMQAGWSCPGAACVAAHVEGPYAAEIAFGAGLVLRAPTTDPAVAAGQASLLHGMEAPFYPQRAPKAGRPGRMPTRPR